LQNKGLGFYIMKSEAVTGLQALLVREWNGGVKKDQDIAAGESGGRCRGCIMFFEGCK